jgi:hypothetical protein
MVEGGDAGNGNVVDSTLKLNITPVVHKRRPQSSKGRQRTRMVPQNQSQNGGGGHHAYSRQTADEINSQSGGSSYRDVSRHTSANSLRRSARYDMADNDMYEEPVKPDRRPRTTQARGKSRKRVPSYIPSLQPLEYTYLDKKMGPGHQYELSVYFQAHEMRVTSADAVVETDVEPLALRWRASRNEARNREHEPDLKIPRTLKMHSTREEVRQMRTKLNSYIHRIDSVRAYVDSTSAPRTSYASRMQKKASRRANDSPSQRRRRAKRDTQRKTKLEGGWMKYKYKLDIE